MDLPILAPATPVEPARSLLSARLMQRLMVLLLPYEAQYDILPSLEFELPTGRFVPDMAILSPQQYRWERDIIRCTVPPITAIDMVTPAQSVDELMTKAYRHCFPNGSRSAWIIAPFERRVCVLQAGQLPVIFAEGSLLDPATGIKISLDSLFC